MNKITITWLRASIDREGNNTYRCKVIKDGKEVLSAEFLPHSKDTMEKVVKHLRFRELV